MNDNVSSAARMEVTVGMVIRRWSLALVGILGLVGCDSVPEISTFEPITDPAKLFMSVTLEHRAINLSTAAPYDTFRLKAVPRNGLGEPISNLPAPTYTSKDTTRVWVSPDGLLQARGPATDVMVIAELVTDENIRHADTAYVNVTNAPNPPQLAELYIDTAPSDKLVLPMMSEAGVFAAYLLAWLYGVNLELLAQLDLPSKVRAVDSAGNPIPDLAIEYESLNPQIADVDRWSGTASPWREGSTRIVVRTVAYGVVKADTAEVVVTLPNINGVIFHQDEAGNVFPTVNEVIVKTNGMVFWTNMANTRTEIVFDDPENVIAMSEYCSALGGEHCIDGNIPTFGHEGEGEPDIFTDLPHLVRGRRFPVPGVYTYRATATGHTGRVVVKDSEVH